MAAHRLTPVGLVPSQLRPLAVELKPDPGAALAALEDLERLMNESRTAALGVHAAALRARRAGVTWEELARTMGLSHASGARKRVLHPSGAS
jgi:predicted ATP-grasp superfamily ATP-dependent carboligase